MSASSSEKFIQQGVLEYDKLECEEDLEIKITIVYPSHKVSTDNNEFEQRHNSMQEDADEHYQLLSDLQ